MEIFRRIWLAVLLTCASSALAQPGSVLINEIMYDDTSGSEIEWVELYNTQPFPRTLSNWVITDGNVFPPPSTEGALLLPPGTFLPPNGYLVISRSPIAEFPGAVVANEIDATWALNNGGDNLALFDGNGPTAQLIDGSLTTQYPDLAGTNSGNSIEKNVENMPWDPAPEAWHESTFEFSPVGRYRHCTPGMPNSPLPPLGCDGLTAESALVAFAPTLVGSSTQVQIMVTATGPRPTCTTLQSTYSNLFQIVTPLPEVMVAGEVQPLVLAFTPTVEGDFEGVVWLRSADASAPPLRIDLEGRGCKPVQLPPPLYLFPATAPNALQFKFPWDPNNGDLTEYAIEYSPDGFVTTYYSDFPIGSSLYPVFRTSALWGQSGTNILSGLEPFTAYNVRLVARDCAGGMIPGPPEVQITLEALSLQSTTPIDLSIQPLGNDMIRLHWDPTITADNGRILQNAEWAVLYGPTESTIDQILTTTTGGVFDIDVSGLPTLGFYQVVAIADNVINTPQPMIAWPPDGARVAGRNVVILSDYLHYSHWLNFTVWLDLYDDPVLLGSDSTNPWNLAGQYGIPVDFTDTSPGLHAITARVNFVGGGYNETTVPIEIVQLQLSSINALYDSTTRLFTCDTADVVLPFGTLADILWQTSGTGNSTGGTTTLPFFPEQVDSLQLAVAHPVIFERVLTLTPTAARNELLYAGLWPDLTNTFVKWRWINIRCCCDGMLLRTSGTANGTYGDEKNLPLGPQVSCKDGNYHVGFAFEMVYFIGFELADAWESCYFGQDAKGDRTRERVKCTGGPPPTGFESLDPPVSTVVHKTHNGTSYPRGGAAWGNDDYRPDNNGGYLDMSRLVKGRVRYFDEPASSGPVPATAGFGFRRIINDQFFARGDPDCVDEFCCLQWEHVADVTFCSDCTIIQTTPPTIQNEIVPDACPGLAAN